MPVFLVLFVASTVVLIPLLVEKFWRHREEAKVAQKVDVYYPMWDYRDPKERRKGWGKWKEDDGVMI